MNDSMTQLLKDDDYSRIVNPLFCEKDDGIIPTSPIFLEIDLISLKVFLEINAKWHSKLPFCGNCWAGFAYGAAYKNRYYAVAWWSMPIASNRLKHGKNILELRRMAISEESPKNTASRFLSIMVKDVKKKHPHIYKLISYQDTSVHLGTIYKASGWKSVDTQKNFQTWKNRPGRVDQSDAVKVRWERLIGMEPNEVKTKRPEEFKGLFEEA